MNNLHLSLSKMTGDFVRIDKQLFATQNRVEAFREMGWLTELEELSDQYIEQLEAFRQRQYKKIGGLMKKTPFAEWIDEYRGLGLRSVGLVTGLLPYWEDIHSVGATWKLLGLHVNGGTAPKQQDGRKLGFDPKRRAFALKRVGEPAMRMADGSGAYRVVFDERREKSLKTHPPMFNGDSELTDPGCEGCTRAMEKTKQFREQKNYERERTSPSVDCGNILHNAEGSHWTKAHRYKDNLRVMTKAIFEDWWRVGHGKQPVREPI